MKRFTQLKKNLKKIHYWSQLLISFPHPTKKITHSEYSGNLHIIWRDGKKILESDNANYSFASLHRIMRYVFTQLEILPKKDILLLGLWWGSVIKILRKELKKENKIIAVDIDPVIIDIAKKEFFVEDYPNTEIICQDAYDFVIQSKGEYGLIIADLWIDNTVPEKFFSLEFWEYILGILSKDGYLVFNMLIATTNHQKLYEVIQYLEKQGLEVRTYDKVDRTNRLVIAKKVK